MPGINGSTEQLLPCIRVIITQWVFHCTKTLRKHRIKRPKWLKIKGCAELGSVLRYKLVQGARSITIISIMCPLQRSSWTSFVMKMCVILFPAFILKCMFRHWRCVESFGYISKSDPPVLIWAFGLCSIWNTIYSLAHWLMNTHTTSRAHTSADERACAKCLTVSGKLNVLR